MFSCCRATSKAAKKDKDKDKQCKNDANVTNEQLPTDTANEQVTQEEVKANGQVSKPEQQAETQPQPQPESKPAPEPKPEPETQTELAAETEQDSVHIEPPTGIHNMYFICISLSSIYTIGYAVPLLGALIHTLCYCVLHLAAGPWSLVPKKNYANSPGSAPH